MFKLDNDFLTSLGLGSLPVDEKNKLLQAIYERLEMNVGMRLAEKMTDAQLDEFEGFIDRNEEAGALSWLETNFPNYKQVVAEELEKLKSEVAASAPQILTAAQNAAVTPQAPASPGMPEQISDQPPAPTRQPWDQQPQPPATNEQPAPPSWNNQPPTPPSTPQPPTSEQPNSWSMPPAPESPGQNQQPPAGFPPTS